jgi:hypothetical protein
VDTIVYWKASWKETINCVLQKLEVSINNVDITFDPHNKREFLCRPSSSLSCTNEGKCDRISSKENVFVCISMENRKNID